jgi:lactoylglutathione lyase
MGNRPFAVLGVQQIALGSPDRRALEALWVHGFGLDYIGAYRSQSENVDEQMYGLGLGLGRVEVDLMQPFDSQARPTVHAPALHHVGLWIDDLRSAVCWLARHGVRFTRGGIRRGAAGHDVCFVHPKPSQFFPVCGQGALIELVQAPPNVIALHGAARQAAAQS